MATQSPYRFVFRRIVDDAIVGELFLTDVTFGFAVNGFGNMTAKVSMADVVGGNAQPFLWTTPGRFILCIERAGVLEWHGPIWSRTRDYDSRQITFQGNEWGSIYDRRVITTDFDYDGWAAATVAMQLLTDGGLGVGPLTPNFDGTTPGAAISGVFSEAQHMTYFAALLQIASDGSNGFTFRWEAFNVNNAIARFCTMGAPLGSGVAVIQDYMAPGGGGSIDRLTADDTLPPNIIYGFSPEGDRVAADIRTYSYPSADFPTAQDLPFDGTEALTFGDLTDDEILRACGSQGDVYHYDAYMGGSTYGTYRLGFFARDVAPSSSAYPKVGQRQTFTLQDSPGSTPKSITGLVLAKNCTIGSDGTTSVELTIGGGY